MAFGTPSQSPIIGRGDVTGRPPNLLIFLYAEVLKPHIEDLQHF